MAGLGKLVGVLKAAGEDTRLRLLALLADGDHSVKDLTEILDQSQPRVSRHLRLLADAGLLVEAGEEKIRGGVAKRYQHPWDETKMIAEDSPPQDYGAYVAAMAAEMTRRYGSQRRKGTLVDAELWVTPEVWEKVRDMVIEASKLIHASAQPPRSEGTVHVGMTAAAFLMEDNV